MSSTVAMASALARACWAHARTDWASHTAALGQSHGRSSGTCRIQRSDVTKSNARATSTFHTVTAMRLRRVRSENCASKRPKTLMLGMSPP